VGLVPYKSRLCYVRSQDFKAKGRALFYSLCLNVAHAVFSGLLCSLSPPRPENTHTVISVERENPEKVFTAVIFEDDCCDCCIASSEK
jgi:hypothetical protein